MASVVTRKIPEIVLVDKEQLGAKESTCFRIENIIA